MWSLITTPSASDDIEVTVIVRSSDAKAISSVLESLQSPEGEGEGMKFAVCEVPDSEDIGSADALRTLRGRVKVRVKY